MFKISPIKLICKVPGDGTRAEVAAFVFMLAAEFP